MKKIITYVWLLFSLLSNGQVQNCSQEFEEYGYDSDPTVLTINASDLNCAYGDVNSITITDVFLDDYDDMSNCGQYYGFTLNIDGEISTVCGDDLMGMVITDFQTLTITSNDQNEEEDFILMYLEITTNYTLVSEPNCATVTGPATNVDAAFAGIITWNAAPGASGYKISVGTESGGTDILNMHAVANVTRYDIPGLLAGGTDYFVTVIPFNSIGDAIGCEEYTFSTLTAGEGDSCETAYIISQLPFTVTGTTQDNLDSLFEGAAGANGCGSTSAYLNGNDAIYAYTAEITGSITVKLTPTEDYAGVFIYNDCNSIGVNCLAGATNSGSTSPLLIENFEVVAGTTYYIVISTYASPQTTGYTLNITEDTCTDATLSYTTITNCEGAVGEFSINVVVTNLGSAQSLTISDNQESATQNVTQTGTITFGPYTMGTQVVITTNNDQDESCELISSVLTVAQCPPNCENAVVITACNTPQTANFVAGEGYWSVENDCTYTAEGVELLYSFTPETTGQYNLTVVSATGGYVDYLYKVASGTCTESGWICIDDLNGATTKPIGTLTAGVEYIFLLDSEGITARSQVFKIDCLPTCTNPTVNYSMSTNCETGGEEFSINVQVSDLGTAESLTITDNHNSDAQSTTQTGTFTFGPYLMGTEVVITTNNDQDETCEVVSNEITVTSCPPSNDECINAIALEVGNSFEQNVITATNVSATRNPADHDPEEIAFGCDSSDFNEEGKDVWFSITVPDSGKLTVETNEASDDLFDDTALFIYTGSCDDMVYLACSGDEGDGAFSKVQLTELTPGETIHARVFGYNGDSGEFQISAYDTPLNNDNFTKGTLSVYPNPVKDVLNISYFKNITNVEVYNLLGQKMLQKTINESSGVLNMESLATGAYVVKIYAEGQAQSIKVMKQ